MTDKRISAIDSFQSPLRSSRAKVLSYYEERQQRICDRVIAPAWAERDRVAAPAWAKYQRAIAPAKAERDRVAAPAQAECERVVAPALAEYQRIDAEARAESDRAIAPAWAEYNRAYVEALFWSQRAIDQGLTNDEIESYIRMASAKAVYQRAKAWVLDQFRRHR